MKSLLLFLSILLGFSGCSTKNNQIDTLYQDGRKISIQHNQVFDMNDQNIAKYKLEFVQEVNFEIKQHLTFYITNLPYERKINLCDGNENKIITKITEENGAVVAIEKNKTFDCSGELMVQDFIGKDFLNISYNFKFLTGFNILRIKDVDIKLPMIYEVSSSPTLIKNNATSDINIKEDNIKKVYERFYIKVQSVNP